jgi:hypothetical protein
MDTAIVKHSGTGKPRPPVVEALLAEVAELDTAAVQERMLPAGCYTAPEFFAFEQAEVFSRTWICVGRVEQWPSRVIAWRQRLPASRCSWCAARTARSGR